MGNDGEDRRVEPREDFLVPLLILTFAACSWLVYVYANLTWLPAVHQVASWIIHPVIIYTPAQITGFPMAVLATVEVLLLGATCSYGLLSNEKDGVIRFLSALGLGFGLAGFVTIILGIFGDLFKLPLNITVLVLCTVFLSAIVYRKTRMDGLTLRKCFTPRFSFKFSLPQNFKFWFPACLAIGVIFFFTFYHALLTVIVHWDAVVYHAAMANIMYDSHGIPVIAGPSIGIEMSANFPPLFSALGAFYYIQIGGVEDFFLRAIPPLMGVLTVLATYKIGEILAGKKFGLLSALFLAVTPLFFRYSIYATSYSALTFFCTASILFLLLGIVKGDTKYWICSGLLFGFALLTSYETLYLVPFFIIALIAYLTQTKNALKISVKRVSVLLLPALVVGGVWYMRNYFAVGNPIYPNAYTVLGGLNIDPVIEQATFSTIKLAATINFFGGLTSPFDKLMIFLTYRTYFPSVSLLTVLGLVLLLTVRIKKFWLIALWPLSLSALILSGVSWAFPHHLDFAMPGFALISAVPIMKALDMCKKFDADKARNALLNIGNRLPSIRKSNLLRVGIVAILFVAFLFPSLTLVMGGKIAADNLNDQMPSNYLWFLEHPNADTWTVLHRLYPQAAAWQFMNENLSPNEKAATVENNIYYVKNCNNSYFFYLDGWEAKPLYNITDPALMVQFLRNQNVKYIIDVSWTRPDGIFKMLPLTKYLGSPSPYFPTILDDSGNPSIYNVGPIESPITNDSATTISTNIAGWSPVQTVDGMQTQSVVAGNNSARLYVATPNLTLLSLTYLDVGTDVVSINAHDPYSNEWTNGYTAIQKTDTGKWKSFEFLVPYSDHGYVELGLHAYAENFTVSKITAEPYQVEGHVALNSFNSTVTMSITDKTVPPTLMVYLPIVNESENIQINATGNGNKLCIELYDGVIQPWETTGWWLSHDLVSRVPDSIVNGVKNPSLTWETQQSGFYTVVIVLRQDYDVKNATIDVQIWNGDSTGHA